MAVKSIGEARVKTLQILKERNVGVTETRQLTETRILVRTTTSAADTGTINNIKKALAAEGIKATLVNGQNGFGEMAFAIGVADPGNGATAEYPYTLTQKDAAHVAVQVLKLRGYAVTHLNNTSDAGRTDIMVSPAINNLDQVVAECAVHGVHAQLRFGISNILSVEPMIKGSTVAKLVTPIFGSILGPLIGAVDQKLIPAGQVGVGNPQELAIDKTYFEKYATGDQAPNKNKKPPTIKELDAQNAESDALNAAIEAAMDEVGTVDELPGEDEIEELLKAAKAKLLAAKKEELIKKIEGKNYLGNDYDEALAAVVEKSKKLEMAVAAVDGTQGFTPDPIEDTAYPVPEWVEKILELCNLTGWTVDAYEYNDGVLRVQATDNPLKEKKIPAGKAQADFLKNASTIVCESRPGGANFIFVAPNTLMLECPKDRKSKERLEAMLSVFGYAAGNYWKSEIKDAVLTTTNEGPAAFVELKPGGLKVENLETVVQMIGIKAERVSGVPLPLYRMRIEDPIRLLTSALLQTANDTVTSYPTVKAENGVKYTEFEIKRSVPGRPFDDCRPVADGLGMHVASCIPRPEIHGVGRWVAIVREGWNGSSKYGQAADAAATVLAIFLEIRKSPFQSTLLETPIGRISLKGLGNGDVAVAVDYGQEKAPAVFLNEAPFNVVTLDAAKTYAEKHAVVMAFIRRFFPGRIFPEEIPSGSAGLRFLIESDGRMTVIGTSSSGAEEEAAFWMALRRNPLVNTVLHDMRSVIESKVEQAAKRVNELIAANQALMVQLQNLRPDLGPSSTENVRAIRAGMIGERLQP